MYPDINKKELKFIENHEVKLKLYNQSKDQNYPGDLYDRRNGKKNCRRACRGSMNPCCWILPT